MHGLGTDVITRMVLTTNARIRDRFYFTDGVLPRMHGLGRDVIARMVFTTNARIRNRFYYTDGVKIYSLIRSLISELVVSIKQVFCNLMRLLQS